MSKPTRSQPGCGGTPCEARGGREDRCPKRTRLLAPGHRPGSVPGRVSSTPSVRPDPVGSTSPESISVDCARTRRVGRGVMRLPCKGRASILVFGDPHADGRSAHNESYRTACAGERRCGGVNTDRVWGSVSPCRTPSRPPTPQAFARGEWGSVQTVLLAPAERTKTDPEMRAKPHGVTVSEQTRQGRSDPQGGTRLIGRRTGCRSRRKDSPWPVAEEAQRAPKALASSASLVMT